MTPLLTSTCWSPWPDLAERHDDCVATFDKAMASLAHDAQRVLVLDPD